MHSFDLKRQFKNYPVSTTFITLNVLVYIYTTLRYGFTLSAFEAYEAGAYNPVLIDTYHAYTHLLRASFLHFGLVHLLCNMMSLYNLSYFLEPIFGKERYTILALCSALGTNLLPYLLYKCLHIGNIYTISAGASGMVLGIIGGLCCLSVQYKGLFQRLFKSILPSLVLVALMSVSVSGISASGHLFGFISGFVTMFIIVRVWPRLSWSYYAY